MIYHYLVTFINRVVVVEATNRSGRRPRPLSKWWQDRAQVAEAMQENEYVYAK